MIINCQIHAPATKVIGSAELQLMVLRAVTEPWAFTYHILIIFSATWSSLDSKLLESSDCVLAISSLCT